MELQKLARKKYFFSKFGKLKSKPKFYSAIQFNMTEILVEAPTSEDTLINTIIAQAKKTSAKPKKVEDEDLDDDEDVAPKKASKKGKDDEDDDDEEDVEKDDDWEKGDDAEEEWDPDFEEFDLPKSKKGKSSKGEEEEDFKVEEEEDFKDMDLFNDGGFDDEEEDF
jgi:DNA-directed RNA polymerase subunit delta